MAGFYEEAEMKRDLKSYILIILAAVLAGCGDSRSNDVQSSENAQPLALKSEEAVTVSIPEFPFDENQAVKIDKDVIEMFARQYAAEESGTGTNEEFFLGYLPLKSADMLCAAGDDAYEIRKLLGNLYVSGYFGGVWLRDAMRGDKKRAEVLLSETLSEGTGETIDSSHVSFVFDIIIAAAAMKIKRAESGGSASIAACRLSLPSFLLIYGYNWGYLDYILNNPPEGADGIERPCYCTRMLDCTVDGLNLETLNEYKDERDLIEDPRKATGVSALRWYEMRLLTGIWAGGAVSTGSVVWENIMNEDMDKDAYALLLDLSARFMLVAEMSIMPAMKGYADSDVDACRCGLLEQAAMIVWAGSYFMGLSSDAPAGTFPSINGL
jgi:hypothetical protein